MLKKPSAPLIRKSPSSAMEVESTRVHVLADGRKLIDVTMRRPEDGAKQDALVMPHFEDESSSSSSEDDEKSSSARRALPVSSSPQRKAAHRRFDDSDQDDDNGGGNNNSISQDLDAREAGAIGMTATFQGEFKWDSVGDIQQLTNANAQLAAQASEFKRQIKLLQVQLEALAPVPGLNPEAIQELLLERDDGGNHDIRDAKIVHQAKTLRHLKRSLQREKQLAVEAARQCKLLESAKQQLEREVETLKLKAARIQARASAAGVTVQLPAAAAGASVQADNDGGSPEQRQSSSSTHVVPTSADSSAKKKIDELRAKHDKLQLDFKKLQRALQREVGDGVALDEILDGESAGGGKRGRAQQIVMLKAKVKKLEAELLARSIDPATDEPAGAAGGSTTQSHNDVDTRAQQELSGQHAHRQRLVDKLSLERDELQERSAQQAKKLEAVRSRCQTLEKEKQESRGKFQVLVDKSRNDDALIDALQKQLETWKGRLQEVKRARTAEGAQQLQQVQFGGGGPPKSEMVAELERLRSLVAEYKRQHQQQQPAGVAGMPAPSEASQYRATAAEKERLQDVVRALQAQLEDKERQLRQAKQQQPPMPSMLPSLTEDASLVSRIPRKPGVPVLGRGGSMSNSLSSSSSQASDASSQNQQQQATGSVLTAAEAETLRRAFRESIKAKEDQIAALTNRLHDLQQEQQQQGDHAEHDSAATEELALEVQDLQDENQFLRQEFDKLKTRYEALARSSKNPNSSSAISSGKLK